MKLSTKLLTFGLIMSVLPAGLISVTAIWQGNENAQMAAESSLSTATDELNHVLDGFYSSVVLEQEWQENTLENGLRVATNVLSDAGAVSLGKASLSWQARNQLTAESLPVELPVMLIGSQQIVPNNDPKSPSPVVDKVKMMIGGVSTIFQRMNPAGDMLRVVTNVEDKSGKRAIGTFIPAKGTDGKPNPIIRSVLGGKTFVGRARVVDAMCVTAYEPLKDAQGYVIGMLFVGVPDQPSKYLLDVPMNTVIGKTGYIYVLDSTGKYVVSQGGERNGEVIWDAKDANGRLFIQDIIKKAVALKSGEVAVDSYPWKNPKDPVPRKKIVHFKYFPNRDWIIAAGSYEDEFLESKLAIDQQNLRLIWILSGIFLLAGATSLAGWVLISRSISRPILQLAESLSEGSDQVTAASGEISGASQSLAEGASEQAASLEETSASLEEIASMTKRNAENALSAKDLSNETHLAAETGASNMEEMNRAMADIQSSSGNVSKIIKTIDEIAFQTNILALNAAVEAARAGEAGMGFAVVADEVRNLAQRSAQAAKETAEKIEDSIAKSANGVAISGKVSESLDQILTKARQVDEIVAEIATASHEQSQGIDQVNSTVTQMDKVTQTNAAAAEETASASEELNAQAETLREIVAELKALVTGSTANAAHVSGNRLVKTQAGWRDSSLRTVLKTRSSLTSSSLQSNPHALPASQVSHLRQDHHEPTPSYP